MRRKLKHNYGSAQHLGVQQRRSWHGLDGFGQTHQFSEKAFRSHQYWGNSIENKLKETKIR